MMLTMFNPQAVGELEKECQMLFSKLALIQNEIREKFIHE